MGRIKEMKRKIAVIIGHNEVEQGAYSEFLKSSEYNFFKEVAYKMQEKNVNIVVFERKYCRNYSSEVKRVLTEIYDYELKYFISFSFIVELHFNSADVLAEGCEVIVKDSDEKAKKIAKRKYIIKIE